MAINPYKSHVLITSYSYEKTWPEFAGRTLLLPMGRLPSTSVAESLVKGLRLAAQQGADESLWKRGMLRNHQ